MKGHHLIKKIISATGLPSDSPTLELERLICSAGISPENLSLDELREILSDYLQDVLLSAKNEFSADP